VNKFITILLSLILFNCSLDTKSGIWTKEKKIEDIVKLQTFKKNESITKELNTSLNIQFLNRKGKSYIYDNNTNNTNVSDFDKQLKNQSKFKFRKIDNFNYFEPDLVTDGKNFVFFDNNLNLFKFDREFNKSWKNIYHSKNEKKNKPLLAMALSGNSLIIADNIGKIFKIDFKTGKVLWKKLNRNPFNSQIKIYKDKVYAADLSNTLICFSLKNGKQLWKFNSENTFIKSDQRISIAVKDNIVFFNNSIGDITALDANNGVLIWQTPTQNTLIYENAFSLKTSDIVISDENLIFSNNKNELYSISIKNGVINWKQNISSNVRPVIIENFIFSVSTEGYLYVIDKITGNIVKITDLFVFFKKKSRNKIFPVGFVIGKKELFLTTSNGRLLTVDFRSGKTVSIKKIDNYRISRPYIFKDKILIVKDNSIIKLE
jgi:outer membrane protein assembly factor BamB